MLLTSLEGGSPFFGSLYSRAPPPELTLGTLPAARELLDQVLRKRVSQLASPQTVRDAVMLLPPPRMPATPAWQDEEVLAQGD